MTFRRFSLVVLTAVAALAAGTRTDVPVTSATSSWSWPLDPRPAVVRSYEPPPAPYAPGHRGVDLAGAAGAPVLAVDDGVVAYAGRVAGVEVVSVDHDGVRSTYQPVAASVSVGERVRRGQMLGRLLLAGGHCLPDACLHLGRRHGSAYADPMDLLGQGPAVRLVTPYGPPPVPPAPVPFTAGPGTLVTPVDAPVSSPYGMRLHPLTGELKLHDGTDFAAPCGTPVRSAARGRVIAVTYDPAYGNRVVVDHGGALTTSYNHLTGAAVSAGAEIEAGQVVGTVGSTGLSTGCHLHFMVVVGGRAVDPMDYL